MCLLPENEQDAAMDDMGAHLDDKAARMMACCPVNQDIGLRMHRVPSGTFIASDFTPAMPEIDEELRDGTWAIEIKQAAVMGAFILALLLATKLPFIDWGHVLGAMWGAR